MNQNFVALSVSRRAIAAAIFSGEKLEFWQVRTFQATIDRANNTVTSFLNSIFQTFEIEAAGLEELPEDLQTRMALLNGLAENLLQKRGIPVLKASEADLFAAFGEPCLRSRAALRQVAGRILPQLKNPSASKELLDAAVLGLHIQTERLLLKAEQQTNQEEIN
jgi:hypothetical protein